MKGAAGMGIGSGELQSAAAANQRNEVPDIGESSHFRRRKAHLEFAFNQQHQPHVRHAVPTWHITCCQLRLNNDVIVIKQFVKDRYPAVHIHHVQSLESPVVMEDEVQLWWTRAPL